MPTGYQIEDQSATYYLTLQVVDWIDIFTRPVYAPLGVVLCAGNCLLADYVVAK